MITLGIFGDSFAAEWPLDEFGGDSWPLKIAKIYNSQNFAKAGSSLEYSIDLFEKNHRKFDKVLFVATFHPRVYYPTTLQRKGSNISDSCLFWVSSEQCREFLKLYEDSDKTISKMQFLFDTIDSDQNQTFLNIQYGAMLRYILSIRHDTILLPGCGFYKDTGFWQSQGYSWDLSNIYSYETHAINLTDEERWMQDKRPNHLSIENHAWVLEHIIGRLNNKFIDWSPVDSYYFKSKEDIKKYFAYKVSSSGFSW